MKILNENVSKNIMKNLKEEYSEKYEIIIRNGADAEVYREVVEAEDENKAIKAILDDVYISCGDTINIDYADETYNESSLKESDANDEFIQDLKNLLNKHCRVNIKEMKLSPNREKVIVDGKEIDIYADSNLAAILDIVKNI